MTALAWFLGTALLWALLLFGCGIVYTRADAAIPRHLLQVHLAVFAIIVGFELYWFLGVAEYGSPRIPLQTQRRIEHQGFYAGPTGEFTFAGRPRANQFPAPPLMEEERISLRPQTPDAAAGAAPPANSAALPLWTISYRCWRYPLRLNGAARNLNADWWLAASDAFELRAGNEFVTMTYRVGDRKVGPQPQKLAFRFGSWVGSSRRLYGDEEVVLRSQPIRDGISLGVLLRSAPAESVSTSGQVPPALLALADAVTLVRERRGDTSSRLGLLVNSYDVDSARLTKNGQALSPRVSTLRVEPTVAGGAELSYGLGDSDRFAVTIPASITKSDDLGPVVIIRFVASHRWPLPPDVGKQFLISSRQEDSPADGYWIDIGSGERAFYAKAQLHPNFSALLLNTGSALKTYSLNSPFLLGDRVHGAVAALTSARQSVRYAGLIAISLLVFAVLAFAALLQHNDDSPGARFTIAYILSWELVVLILSTRLVLAFRGSLLPPSDARITQLFDNGLRVSLWAFVVIPVVLLLPLVARRLLQPSLATSDDEVSNLARFWIWIPPAILSAYVVVAFTLGRQSLLMRVNHLVVLLMVVVLAWTARHWTRFERWWLRAAFFVALMSPLVLNMILLDDNGAYIYLLAFVIVFILQLAVHREYSAGVLLSAAAIVVVLFFTVFPFVMTTVGRLLLQNQVIGPETETVYYRLIAQSEAEADVMGQEAGSVPVSRQLLLRNVHQNWQMLLYSTKGAREPVGYGAAPLTNRGMSYPVMLTDAAFSQLLLIEHGAWAALAVVALYVFFALVCLHVALFLPESLRHRLFPFLGAATIFGLTALYMASGNIGMAVFTGLNLPLLGLYSWSDVVLGGAIALIVVWLMTWNVETSTSTPDEDHPLLMTMMKAVIVGLGVWFVALGVVLFGLRGSAADDRLKDYRLDRDLVRKLEIDLNPHPGRNPCWQVSTGTTKYELAPGCTASVLERIAVDEFNQRSDKRDPRGGLIYIDGARLAVNDNYFTVASPFREQDLWTGRVLTSETSTDIGFVLLGRPLRLALAPSGESSSIFLTRPTTRRMGRSILIAERPSQPRICEIARMPSGETWLSSKHADGWQIFVEGFDIDTDPTETRRMCGQPHSRGCRRLAEGDVIVLERRERDALQQRHTLLFVGEAPTPVLFTKWVNGSRKHILPHAALASFGYSLGYAIDRMPASRRPGDLVISLDPSLHADLQEIVERYARGDSYYRRSGLFEGPRIALAAVDASTGETLALPAWPVIDVRADDFEERLETTPSGAQYRLLQNPNYANHAIGSTIKPLVFSTVATALAPHVQIERMVVFNRADAIPPQPPDAIVIHPHTQVAGLTLRDFWDCHSVEETIDARTFLVRSRNYYEVILGMIGLFQRPADWGLAMQRAEGRADLLYGGTPMSFDVKRVPDYAMTSEAHSYARTETMKQSLLFRNLSQMFPVSVGDTIASSYPSRCASFLPSLCNQNPNALPSASLIFSVPEPVVLQPQDFQELGQAYIRGFLIGGSLSRWNNVSMAESFARVGTGRRIESRLEARPIGPPPLRPVLPGPIGRTEWRDQNLIQPLTDVVEDEVGHGTARRLADVVPDPYTVIAKTGTINEGIRGRESELFAAVVGPRANAEFVFGRTVAFYLYMQEAKPALGPMKKFDLAEPLLRRIASYLNQRAGAGTPPPSLEPPSDPSLPPSAPIPPGTAVPPTPPAGDASGIEGVLERTLEGVVGIYAGRASGTGFFADNCRIITNYHVIDDASEIEVVTHDGGRYDARVLASSETKDLAILAIPVRNCVGLSFETDRAHLGETVFAVGHPMGLLNTVSRGIVSVPSRFDGERQVIQTDAAVSPGNSGGPLINERGRVLGIMTYKRRGERLNFAVAISELEEYVGHLR